MAAVISSLIHLIIIILFISTGCDELKLINMSSAQQQQQQQSSIGIGINYGQIANNLPTPSSVLPLIQSIKVSRLKLYDSDPTVLQSFAGSDISFTVGLPNDLLPSMASSPSAALQWVQTNIQTHLSAGTKITSLTVGNEILTGTDTNLINSLLPAMRSVHSALSSLNLSSQVSVSSPNSVGILSTSFPPSAGAFNPTLAQYIQPLLSFHSQTNSPFLINAYPFFAYMDDPTGVSLDYVLFRDNNPGTTDPNTGLHYDNMLYAQIDAVYAAMKAMGHSDIPVQISETGWPSKGDSDEVGATPENAAAYNGNLAKRVGARQGTPAKPGTPVDVYVFALFNEDMKPGPTSERNYGLYYPNATAVYHVGFLDSASGNGGYLPQFYSSSGYYISAAVAGKKTAKGLYAAAADGVFTWIIVTLYFFLLHIATSN